jgi:3-methyladenine DNA glycosylase/8-oxoguanine DNA glycosylase
MAAASIPLDPVDLRRSSTLQRLGAYDPTVRAGPALLQKAFAGPAGVLHATLRREPGSLAVELRGPGADAVLEGWLGALPPDDGYDTFAPASTLLRRLHRGLPGLRLLRVPWVFDVACGAILQQRVTWAEACRGWRSLATRFGHPDGDAVAFPSPARLLELPSWEFSRLGIDHRRTRAMHLLAREELRHPFLSVRTPRDELRRRLAMIPGIGPWTTALVLGTAAGDADAVPVGDLHLPHLVTWALAGEPRGSDERMLELLAPYAGQRFRVVRLLLAAPQVRDPSR